MNCRFGVGYAFAPDNALIAELAMGSNDVIRTILAILLRYTREKKNERTFDRLLLILGEEFQRDSAERALNRMAAFNSSHRGNSESTNPFWIRYQKR